MTWHHRGQLIKAPAEKLTATSRSSLAEMERGREGKGKGNFIGGDTSGQFTPLFGIDERDKNPLMDKGRV